MFHIILVMVKIESSLFVVKYWDSVYKGPAYAATLREKMKSIQNAVQAMNDRADLNQHMRLKDIRQVTWHGMIFGM